MKKLLVLCVLLCVLCVFMLRSRVSEKITIVSWNVQTFFDAVNDGTEYKEYARTSLWCEELYSERISRLAAAIGKTNADIVALEEIENEAVMQDIANALVFSSGFRYSAFCKTTGGVFGCGVFSRYPLSAATSHQFCLAQEGKSPMQELRPQFFLTAETGGGKHFSFVVCHWKSQSGGERSRLLRRGQELVLSRIMQGTAQCAAIGDFNQNNEDFFAVCSSNGGKGPILLRNAESSVAVYSGWNMFPHTEPFGSYYYRGKWENIDSVFVPALTIATHAGATKDGNCKLFSFEVLNTPPFAGRNGKPFRYEVYTGSGISDHLPIKAVIFVGKE